MRHPLNTPFFSLLLILSLVAGCGKGVDSPSGKGGSGGGNNTTVTDPGVNLLVDNNTVDYNQTLNFTWNVPSASNCNLKDEKGAVLSTSLQGPLAGVAVKYPAAGAYQTYFTLDCLVSGQAYSSRQNVSVREVSDHLIFATSTAYNGNLAGLAGANNICARVAATAGLRPGKVWAAVLTADGKNIRNRFTLTLPVRNMMGETVFATPTTFYDNAQTPPTNAVKYTEAGAVLSPTPVLDVWTGTNRDGNNNSDCSNWTRDDNGNQGQVGFSNSVTGTWTNGKSNEGCAITHSLYCISLPAGTVVNN